MSNTEGFDPVQNAIGSMPKRDLTELLTDNYTEIAAAVNASVNPHFKANEPGRYDDTIRRLMWLDRPLFPKQAEMVCAAEDYLGDHNALLISAATGTGKTAMGIALATNIAKKPEKKVVFIEVPSHLVKKWIAEVDEVADKFDFDVVEVESVDDIRCLTKKGTPPTRRTIFIASKDKMKVTYKTEQAWLKRYKYRYDIKKDRSGAVKTKERFRAFEYYCPDCYHAVSTVKTSVMADRMRSKRMTKAEAEEYFHPQKSVVKCKRCGCKAVHPSGKRPGIAEFLRRYGRKGIIDLALTDEVHESKAKDTLRAMTSGVLINLSEKYVGLTGTLLGGYASHAFYMLYRMFPRFMKEQMGYTWDNPTPFIEEFGGTERIERIELDKNGKAVPTGRFYGTKERAELSPRLQDILLPFVAFLRLDEIRMTEEYKLPPLTESKHIVEFDEQFLAPYKAYCAKLASVVSDPEKTMPKEVRRSLYARLAADALLIPDMPFVKQVVQLEYTAKINGKCAKVVDRAEYMPPLTREEYPLTSKERKLVEQVREAMDKGDRVLIYVDFVSRGIREELKSVLEQHAAVTVDILDVKDAPAKKREAYVKTLKGDVLITNPGLVATGLDLLEYRTICFYEQVYTSFNVFTLRQAKMRSWRIGQDRPVTVSSIAYAGTHQYTVYRLIASKVNISQGVEGRLSDGNDMASEADESIQLEVAKALLGNKVEGNAAEHESNVVDLEEREWNTFELHYLAHLEAFGKDPSAYKEYRPEPQPVLAPVSRPSKFVRPVHIQVPAEDKKAIVAPAATKPKTGNPTQPPKTVTVSVCDGNKKKSKPVTASDLDQMVKEQGRVQLALF